MNQKDTNKFSKRNLPKVVKISIKAGQAKKAENIAVLELSKISSFTDFFIITCGNSMKQNRTICESIEMELKKEKVTPLSIEGKNNAEWILMDYGSFIVHIFSRKMRDYYSLEKLWGDAPKIYY